MHALAEAALLSVAFSRSAENCSVRTVPMRNGYDNFSCVPHIEKYQADLGNTYSHERTEIVVSPEFTPVRVPDKLPYM
jgi:hypothetical protein